METAVDRYKKLNNNLSDFTFDTEEPKLIEKDYQIGFFVRYFVIKRNELNGTIFEISKETRQRLLNNPYFLTCEIRWKIIGNRDEVIQLNKKSIELGKKTIPHLDQYANNLLKFYKG
jgi:hypothetical protein